MLTVILSITAIINFAAIIATYKPQAKYRNGMLFAVALPAHAVDHPGIRDIQAGFVRRMNRTILVTLAASVPFAVLHFWPVYQIIYFLVWLPVFSVALVVPFRRAFRETLALKREHEWFVGSNRIIAGDLRVAHLKNKRAASLWLFAIPFAMSGALVLWAGSMDFPFYGAAFGGLALTALLFVVALLMRRTKGTVFSANSETNLVLNQARRRAVSYLLLTVAMLENAHFLFLYLLLANDNEAMNGVWLAVVLLFPAIPVGLVIYVYRRIRIQEREIIENDGKAIRTDDDEYWANVFTYHNPMDKSVFVPKRVGIGETVNTGTLTGKLIVWGSVALLAVVIAGVSFMLIRSELTSPLLTVESDRQIQIRYPMYSYSFDIGEIREITLVESVPSGFKMNGESTNRYARGHFRLRELGKARLYIFKNNPPYIRMKLDDGYIFYNEEDPAATRRLFVQLERLTD